MAKLTWEQTHRRCNKETGGMGEGSRKQWGIDTWRNLWKGVGWCREHGENKMEGEQWIWRMWINGGRKIMVMDEGRWEMIVNICFEDLEGKVGLKIVWEFVPKAGKKEEWKNKGEQSDSWFWKFYQKGVAGGPWMSCGVVNSTSVTAVWTSTLSVQCWVKCRLVCRWRWSGRGNNFPNGHSSKPFELICSD